MNPLLARQLRRLKIDEQTLPDEKTWAKLLSRLDAVFDHNDQTLSRFERSLTISSAEMQDIYETLSQNEQKIYQQRDQLDAVLGAVHAGICAISPDGELLFINDAGCKLLQVKHEDVQHTGFKASRILPQFHTGQQTLSVERVFEMLSQQRVYSLDHCTLTLNEKEVPVSVHLSALGNDVEKGFVVMAFQDISERLRNEETKQEAQKMAVVGNLVGGIAHELNNLLASITGNLFLAKARLVGHDDVVSRLDIAERLSFDMGDIISHLMAFSGQSVVSRENIAFKILVEKVLVGAVASLPGQVAFGYDICSEHLEIFGTEDQLQQMFNHVLNNAIDATFSVDSPTIQVRLSKYQADAAFCTEHNLDAAKIYAKLSIEDNGCGISKASFPHIFEPFYSGKDFGAGKGLGLSMVQGAVQMHDGIVEVESVVNRGSTFHVYLPLKQQNEALTQADEPGSPLQDTVQQQQAGRSILLVEDDEDVQEIGAALLESLGYSVITANDGIEGVEKYEQYQRDIGLVLMDIMMPRMNGTLACRNIRALNPHVKLIFVSGYDQQSAKLKELSLENELFLSKPYNVTQLHEVIARELGEAE